MLGEQEEIQASDPDRRRERIQLKNLSGKKTENCERRVLVARLYIAEFLEHWKVMERLPDRRRHSEDHRNQSAEQEPSIEHHLALGREHKREQHASAEEHDRFLVLQA